MSSATRAPRSRLERNPVPAPSPSDPIARYAMLPLRLFLGATFAYAGLQKLFDPGYFTPGSDSYIGSQLQSFASISPIGFLFQLFVLPHIFLTGAAVIIVECAVGLFVLIGLWTRGAAIVGALLSLALFLSATWDVQPYFLGSDSIYAVAWITLALVGDQGILSIQSRRSTTPASRYFTPIGPSVIDRRRRAFLLQVGGAAVALIWVLGMLPRNQRDNVTASAPSGDSTATGPTPATNSTSLASPSPSAIDPTSQATSVTTPVALAVSSLAATTPTVATADASATLAAPTVAPAVTSPTPVSVANPASIAAPTSTAVPSARPTKSPPTAVVVHSPPPASPTPPPAPAGTAIGTMAQLQQGGGSLAYTDPASGDPAVAIGLGGNKVVAYDAVCPHAGCTVEYNSGAKLLVCPCHRAMFDPTKSAAVVRGPARRPLAPLQVSVGPDGKIYAV